ncbi:MAG: alpha/beta hydrolase [Caldilineaceae bacterium]
MRTMTATETMKRPLPKSWARNRLLLWGGRVLMSCLVLALIGATYQALASARDARTFPPPGQLVDVGGYKLHIHCTGTGSPTVVTENGLGGSSPDWSLVQPAVSQTTRICSYDRAGTGWSEAGPGTRTSRQISAELHTLLNNAGIAGPYILVGHSAGGLHVQVYASQYPADVAGLVLIDPTPAQAIMRFTPEQRRTVLPNLSQLPLLKVMEFLGVMRLLPLPGAEVLTPLPSTTQAQVRAHRLQSGAMAAMTAEAEGLETSIQEAVEASPLPPERPLLIVWHGIPAEPVELEPLAQANMEELLQQSANSKFVVAEQSGHAIPFERPAVVIDAIDQVITAVRTGTPLR